MRPVSAVACCRLAVITKSPFTKAALCTCRKVETGIENQREQLPESWPEQRDQTCQLDAESLLSGPTGSISTFAQLAGMVSRAWVLCPCQLALRLGSTLGHPGAVSSPCQFAALFPQPTVWPSPRSRAGLGNGGSAYIQSSQFELIQVKALPLSLS